MKIVDVKVGQRVRMISKNNDVPFGAEGTILKVGNVIALVDWLPWTLGHDGGKRLLQKSGWWIEPKHVELISEQKSNSKTLFSSDAKSRKEIPVASGVLDYFPAALAEVAKVSFAGNQQHNPGQPLHWARGKSGDQADTMIRHFLERGTLDTDGIRHSAKMVWRALAILQLELEAEGAPLARGAKVE